MFAAPLRADLVQSIHTELRKNARQPYAAKYGAGHDTAAESWGTGRAVSRIPRAPGGGTHRAGQGAFGNMCRGGHMFSPNRTWRRWHRRVNLKQRRYATTSAVAATAVPALVMARGHKIEDVPELPLVVGAGTENVSKTKNAIDSLKDVGAYREVDKVKDSKNLRRGKGKMRNRRYQQRKGPLVVYSEDSGLVKAFRNLPGVELRRVDQLNLLQLAPGGHMGRFVVWTKPAFEKLDSVFGTFESESLYKKGWKLPKGVMQVPDLHRLINSDEIQSVVKPPKEKSKPAETRTNPLRRHDVMAKLNPHVEQQRKEEKETNEAPKSQSMKKRNKRERLAEAKEAGQRAIKRFKADAEYVGEYFDEFATWIGNKTKSKGAGDNDGGGGDGDSDSSDD